MEKGLIIKSTGSWYQVKTESGELISCTIKGKLRTQDFKSTNPVSVGDWVILETLPGTKLSGVIREICDRKNYIIRKSSNLSKQTQIIASNVDQALLVFTLTFPVTSPEFIDRFLVSSEAYRIPTILILNKTDLYNSELSKSIERFHQIYEPIGYRMIDTSVPNKGNLELLIDLITEKISVISGNSGVGKSSLINMVLGNNSLKTGSISEYHLKGKHTTTFAEMIELPMGGYLIDTPGLKGFGMANIQKEELYHFFPEMFLVSEKCQYHNCLHLDEPNCAVKEAVEKESISSSRYQSYLSILEDTDSKYR